MKIEKNTQYLLFSILATLLVIWKFLLPGYIFILDATSGPHITFPTLGENILSNYVSFLANYFVSFLIGPMMAQKAYLFALFFCLFYFPLKFFPFEVKEWNKYLASLLYVFNPFVYERFLAGQFGVIFGYAFLFPFFYFLIKWVRNANVFDFAKLLFFSFLIGSFSLHIYVMSGIVLLLGALFCITQNPNWQKKVNTHGLVFVIFLICNLYWLLPVVSNNTNIIDTFDQSHEQAFVTKIYQTGVMGYLSIFSLYGFWGEGETWANEFGVVAMENIIFFLVVLFVFVVGVWSVYRKTDIHEPVKNRQDKQVCSLLLVVFFLASVFSVGVSESIFKIVNQFLFEHLFFWRGFRDSQKWTAMMLPVLAIFVILGVDYIQSKINNFYFKLLPALLVSVCILVYSYKVLIGFAPSIKPVNYPEDWYKVNEILQQDSDCSVVFLPWHMYYYLAFNNNVLSSNPASKFFDCRVYTSLDPEFHQIDPIFYNNTLSQQVHNVMEKTINIKDIPVKLGQLGVRYIIVTEDEFYNPEYGSMFPKGIIPIFQSDKIVLLKINDILVGSE